MSSSKKRPQYNGTKTYPSTIVAVMYYVTPVETKDERIDIRTNLPNVRSTRVVRVKTFSCADPQYSTAARAIF